MKVVVCTGSPWAGVEQVGTVLNAAGVRPPVDPVRGNATIESFHAQLQKINKKDGFSFDDQSVHPGRIWGQQALDILLGNVEQEVWGWTNPFSMWLLDFWKSLDQNIYFILVYSTPEEDVARFMQQDINTSSEIPANLWLPCNTQLLRFYNRNRERCLLVSKNAVLSNPSSLLSLCNERFALSLQTDMPAMTAEDQGPDVIGFVLAQSFLKDRDDVYNLYREIQATATQPVEVECPDLIDTAWSAYRQLSLTIAEQQEQYIAELAALERQLEEQHSKLEQCQEENELLLLQLHQVQEELEATFLDSQKKQTDSANSLTEQRRQLEESRRMLDQYKKKVDQLHRESSELVTDRKNDSVKSEQVLDRSKELEQENELLLLQLHQVQEELEHYFLLYQESQAKQEEPPAQVQSDGRIRLQMSELSLGANWYQAVELDDDDQDLRWTGPGTRATIMLPIKRDREQLLVIRYKQVVAQDQLKGIRIEVDSEQVDHTVYNKTSQKYIVVKLAAIPEEHSSEAELAIVLPHTVKPSDVISESPDDRPLGIAVYSISVLPVAPCVRINWPETSYKRARLRRNISRVAKGVESFPLAYFDGKSYLKEYPDVAEAVRQGAVPSAFVHYVQHGFYDGHDLMLADTQLPSEGDEHDLIRMEHL